MQYEKVAKLTSTDPNPHRQDYFASIDVSDSDAVRGIASKPPPHSGDRDDVVDSP
jgi:hypothetical protein